MIQHWAAEDSIHDHQVTDCGPGAPGGNDWIPTPGVCLSNTMAQPVMTETGYTKFNLSYPVVTTNTTLATVDIDGGDEVTTIPPPHLNHN